MEHTFGVTFFGALLAIMNPISVMPLFLALTDGMTAGERRRTGLAVVFYAAVICAVSAVAGQQILRLFGITVDDFRVAGGLVVAIIGLNMLNGGGNPAHEGGQRESVPTDAREARGSAIAFYPLAFPMVVGPGSIATLLLFVQEARTPRDMIVYVAVVAFMIGLLAVALLSAAWIGRHLSDTLRVIMTRLMGLILLAIAIAMMAGGLRALFPALAGAAPA
ncbi:MarC family protein [Amaricoccus sp.]|uniref:MarC family protein n=1 Tax=Amaricoccus sp. TaxID=1872485 RepID=UPI001B3CCED6|nr:MarC family protein [Amaricoccus sp.]MBP7001344.1 NAAT family transporter [Amaricoccus sp.]